jgi:hypothetical protein
LDDHWQVESFGIRRSVFIYNITSSFSPTEIGITTEISATPSPAETPRSTPEPDPTLPGIADTVVFACVQPVDPTAADVTRRY